MSAEIISFPLHLSARVDQQRWIPAPRARRAPTRSFAGWLRLAGVLLAVGSSWLMVLGTAHLIAVVI